MLELGERKILLDWRLLELPNRIGEGVPGTHGGELRASTPTPGTQPDGFCDGAREVAHACRASAACPVQAAR